MAPVAEAAEAEEAEASEDRAHGATSQPTSQPTSQSSSPSQARKPPPPLVVYEVRTKNGSALLSQPPDPADPLVRLMGRDPMDGCLLLAPGARTTHPLAVSDEHSIQLPGQGAVTYRVVRPQSHRQSLPWMFGARQRVRMHVHADVDAGAPGVPNVPDVPAAAGRVAPATPAPTRSAEQLPMPGLDLYASEDASEDAAGSVATHPRQRGG